MCRFLVFLLAGLAFAIFWPKVAHSQGCLIGSKLYTVETTPILGVTIASDLKVYKPPFTAASSCFSGTISTSKACFACENGGRVVLVVGATPLLYVVTCEGGLTGYLATRGTYYSDYVLECGIDDYAWVLGLCASILGLSVIKKMKITKINMEC